LWRLLQLVSNYGHRRPSLLAYCFLLCHHPGPLHHYPLSHQSKLGSGSYSGTAPDRSGSSGALPPRASVPSQPAPKIPSAAEIADEVQKREKEHQSQGEHGVTLSLPCEEVALPIPYPSPGLSINVLDPGTHSGIMRVFVLKPSQDAFWPYPLPAKGDWAYRCLLSNSGDEAVFAVEMIFDIIFRKARRVDGQSNSLQPGETTSSHEHAVEIPKLEGHGTYEFYIYNRMADFVLIPIPTYATLQPASDASRIRVQLKQTTVNPQPLQLTPSHEFIGDILK